MLSGLHVQEEYNVRASTRTSRHFSEKEREEKEEGKKLEKRRLTCQLQPIPDPPFSFPDWVNGKMSVMCQVKVSYAHLFGGEGRRIAFCFFL